MVQGQILTLFCLHPFNLEEITWNKFPGVNAIIKVVTEINKIAPMEATIKHS
jgi:hypothetical protein